MPKHVVLSWVNTMRLAAERQLVKRCQLSFESAKSIRYSPAVVIEEKTEAKGTTKYHSTLIRRVTTGFNRALRVSFHLV